MIAPFAIALLQGDLEEGIALFEAGKRTAALERLARAAQADPKDPLPLLYEGLCLQDLHRLEEALVRLGKARELSPEDPRILNALGRALLDADRLEEAEQLLAPAVDRRASDPDLLFAAGLCAVRSSRAEAARGLLERMTSRAPNHPDAPRAHGMLAQIYARAGEAKRAGAERALGEKKDLWHRVRRTREGQIRENPRDPEAWLGMGLLWMEVGDFARAEEAFGKSAEADPSFARARFHVGEARRGRGDLRGAAEAYGRAIRLDPGYVRAHYHLGLALANLGEAPGAIRALEEVVSLDPESRGDPVYKEAYKNLGRLHEAAGNRERARALYGEYLRRGGADPEVPARLRALGR